MRTMEKIIGALKPALLALIVLAGFLSPARADMDERAFAGYDPGSLHNQHKWNVGRCE